MTELPDLMPCTVCAAQVRPDDLVEHQRWHDRLIDEVVTAVKVRGEDPPRDGGTGSNGGNGGNGKGA